MKESETLDKGSPATSGNVKVFILTLILDFDKFNEYIFNWIAETYLRGNVLADLALSSSVIQ